MLIDTFEQEQDYFGQLNITDRVIYSHIKVFRQPEISYELHNRLGPINYSLFDTHIVLWAGREQYILGSICL